jgi:hypothetical protein
MEIIIIIEIKILMDIDELDNEVSEILKQPNNKHLTSIEHNPEEIVKAEANQ